MVLKIKVKLESIMDVNQTQDICLQRGGRIHSAESVLIRQMQWDMLAVGPPLILSSVTKVSPLHCKVWYMFSGLKKRVRKYGGNGPVK